MVWWRGIVGLTRHVVIDGAEAVISRSKVLVSLMVPP